MGKSTLMNALVGERVSIVTSKQQTTRHQIMGVVTGGDFQIVYYDTPGVLRPNYELQEGMMAFVKESLGDADVVLMMTDVFEDPGSWSDQEIFQQLQQSKRPLLLAVNKVDVFPNETAPLGKLGKEALLKVNQRELTCAVCTQPKLTYPTHLLHGTGGHPGGGGGPVAERPSTDRDRAHLRNGRHQPAVAPRGHQEAAPAQPAPLPQRHAYRQAPALLRFGDDPVRACAAEARQAYGRRRRRWPHFPMYV